MTHRLPIRKTPKRHVAWLIVHLVAMAVLALWIVPAQLSATLSDWAADLDSPLPSHALEQLQALERHLAQPFTGYERHQVLNKNFAAAALSHMAAGLINVAVADPSRKPRLATMSAQLVERALHPSVSPYDEPIDQVKELGEHNLYLTHLGMVLGAHRLISGQTTHDALHRRVAQHLRRQSLRDGDYHARAYPLPSGVKPRHPGQHKWPADQAALLTTLYLYDQVHQERLSDKPIQGWLAAMQSHRDEAGLHLPTLDARSSYAKLPRGSALSWTVLSMTQFAPTQARSLYEAYQRERGHEWFGTGLGGLREWPPGHSRGMDDDSGPILLGVGATATVLGLGGARLARDRATYARVMRTTTSLGLPTVLSTRRTYVSSPILGEAMLFHALTARRWFGDWPDEPLSQDAGHPGGSAIFLLLSVALMAYEAMSARERFWIIRAGPR